MAISSSPAVLLHVAHEVGAKGPLTEAAKTLVALNNVISFVVFSLLLPILHYSADSSWTMIVFQPFYSFVGSMILGVGLAFGLHLIALKTHEAVQYKLALVIGAIMIMAGFAVELKLSVLFVPLAAGVTIKNLEKKTVISDLEFGEAFELFFILLFVFAGAGLHLHELIAYAPAVLAVVSARIVMKFLSVAAIFSIAREPVKKGIAGGLLLLPMAGLAIGLVQESNALFPQHAAVISAIVLGAVTVFETVGPPVASLAFRLAGESGANQNASDRAADVTIEINPE
jgi:Kef-type K+ transport system membrane component KefB